MIKKQITYTDYDGNVRTEDFYFNLTKAELAELQLVSSGGFGEYLEAIAESKDPKVIIEGFKDILFRAYGIKSEDGKRFIKSKQISEEFSQTEAFSVFFMQLVTDTDFAVEFVRGIIPKELQRTNQPTLEDTVSEEVRLHPEIVKPLPQLPADESTQITDEPYLHYGPSGSIY